MGVGDGTGSWCTAGIPAPPFNSFVAQLGAAATTSRSPGRLPLAIGRATESGLSAEVHPARRPTDSTRADLVVASFCGE
jgi:hypothetical protein